MRKLQLVILAFMVSMMLLPAVGEALANAAPAHVIASGAPAYQQLFSFGKPSPGAAPGQLILASDGALYGTANTGGRYGFGTVFKVSTDGTGLTVLENFDGAASGGDPYSGVIQGADGALYGTTQAGGSGDYGTVFKLNPDGTGFTVLQNFDGDTTGGDPIAGLVQGTDGALYGTTQWGGTNGSGTVFKLNTDGTGFTVLVNLDLSSGSNPYSELMQGTDGALYGTAYAGGASGYGTVFKVNPDGTGFARLKSFDSVTTGGNPYAGLIQGTDGALYGATETGGTGLVGTLFKLGTDGTGFTVLKNLQGPTSGSYVNGRLLQGADGTLYGMASQGGSMGYGTLFKLNPDGTGFTVLKNLAGVATGGAPQSGLVQGADGAVYGSAQSGGSGGSGTVFKLNPDGTGFTVLVDFPPYPNFRASGGSPYSGLVQGTDGALYGTAHDGGANGLGTVFKLNPDGTGFALLESFDNFTTGTYPTAALVQGTDGALYGTASYGGSSYDSGTVFKLNPDGTGFTVLKVFDGDSIGGTPYAGLIQGTDGVLYGTNWLGGGIGAGNVFRVNPDGTGFSVILDFDYYTTGGYPIYTGLMQGTDGALYGATSQGGSGGYGTVFELNPYGSDFTVLKNFGAVATGRFPNSGLVEGSDGALYGTTTAGGSNGHGTVFKVNADGTGFAILKSLDKASTGAFPEAGLVQGPDGALYGTTTEGGSAGAGTVFKVNPDGTGFAVVQNFDAVTTGGDPFGKLMLGVDGNLYGTTVTGGDNNLGTVFRLVFSSTPCTGQVDGVSCDDGNACTQSDTCQAGVCVGSNPVTCTALDQCHDAGVCDTGTGVCSNPVRANGAACDDGNACTQTDTCQAGVCQGTNWLWSGILQPINSDDSSIFKLGSTVPVKFQLTGACAGITNASAHLMLTQYSGDVLGTEMEATSTSAADTGNTFRYDATGHQYIFNLSTRSLLKGTWLMRINLGDGVMNRTVKFSFK